MSKKPEKIFVRPARPEVPVRRGLYELPVQGAFVERDFFWQRRVHLGDCVIVDDPETAKEAAAAEKKAAKAAK